MLIRLIFIILFFGSAGCSSNLPFLSQQAKPQKAPKEAVVISTDETSAMKSKDKKLRIDPRLAKILNSPSLIANKKNIEAAQTTVLVVQSQREPVVTAISNVGPKIDNDRCVRLQNLFFKIGIRNFDGTPSHVTSPNCVSEFTLKIVKSAA